MFYLSEEILVLKRTLKPLTNVKTTKMEQNKDHSIK